MRITLISRSWPSVERSGVSLIAAQHLISLVSAGHIVSIIGSKIDISKEQLPAAAMYYVASKGSGALYSLARVDTVALKDALLKSSPDLVIVEAWQTALTDAAVDVAYELNLPVLMISHGVSLHPYTMRFRDIIRSLGWFFYRMHSLPRLMSRISVLTTLDEFSNSSRFFDRDLARKLHIPICSLVNAPVNYTEIAVPFKDRKRQVLVVGYFSDVKNQLAALEILSKLPSEIHLRFIGQRSGAYYLKCRKRAEELGLISRVIFSQDDDCDLASEIANSFVVLSTSVTEVLPVALLEAMASGTPFVSTPVGAIPSIGCGVIASSLEEFQKAIRSLASDYYYWSSISERGRKTYVERYTSNHLLKSLLDATELAIKSAQPHKK